MLHYALKTSSKLREVVQDKLWIPAMPLPGYCKNSSCSGWSPHNYSEQKSFWICSAFLDGLEWIWWAGGSSDQLCKFFSQHFAYMVRSQLKIRDLGPISVEFILKNSLEVQDPMHKTKSSFESGTQYMQSQHILLKKPEMLFARSNMPFMMTHNLWWYKPHVITANFMHWPQ